jgi:PhoPQ-activated pathogenicity-related protein
MEAWPLRLPMTKSVVRATHTVTAFCHSVTGGGIDVDRFVVGGASKRGWTARTAAVVDKRVVAVVPVVIDLLNVEASFEHDYRACGFWAPAIGAYQATGNAVLQANPLVSVTLRLATSRPTFLP